MPLYSWNKGLQTDLGHEKCAPFHRFGPHIRRYHLLHFILKGKGRFLTEEGELELQAGEGFYISPDELTTYVADGKEPWEYLWVGVADRSATREALLRHGLEKGVHRFAFSDRLGLIPGLIACCDNKEWTNYERSMGSFYYLLDCIPLAEKDLPRSSALLTRCYEYMELHYFEELSVQNLADHLNLSRSQLYRQFKELLSLSPQQAILHFRLDKAQELINRGGVSLTQIAYSCGFCDLSHFSKAYKEHFGFRPKQKKP